MTCTNDSSVTPECVTSCALDKAHVLTPSGDGINPYEFGPFYKAFAEDCFIYKAKPTCEEAEAFVRCFHNKSNDAPKAVMEECMKEFPLENVESVKVNEEEMSKNENLACFVACVSDKSHDFTDDDEINLAAVNPHIKFKFDAFKAATQCQEKYKEGSKCLKRANIYMCFVAAYEKEQSASYQQNV